MTIMREEDLEIAIKVVIVGNGAVGKSSMIQRYCKGVFTKDYKKTIGVDFLERQITVTGEEVRLMLWDTAGQEEFDAITKAYYRGAQACVVTFSTVDRDSFLAVRKWKKKVEDECGPIPMVLVQNKIDLIDQATVKPDEVEALARELQMRLYRTSVKEDLNVDQVFNFLVDRYLAIINAPEDILATRSIGENIFGTSTTGNKSKKGDTITLGGKKKTSKKQLIKNACKMI
ncbi:RAS oncogene family member Rab23 [Oratosquilla oratoria]|uniref:RAS oncogene family member Rab23 n=1 Tax=Oratosquilla oratoria TaxID=337810 RepID=UPI003F76B948